MPTVHIDDTQSVFVLGDRVEYLADPEGTLSWKDLVEGTNSDKFFAIEQKSANFGFDSSVYWIRASLLYRPKRSKEEKTFWLSFDYPLLDSIDAYYLDQKGLPVHFEGGDMRPIANNAFDFPRATFALTLYPGKPTEVWIRVDSQSSHQLGLSLYDYQAITDRISHMRLMDGIFVGIMLIMMLYNLFVFLAIRDMAYLHYVIALFFFIMGQFSINGLLWQYAPWKNLAWNSQATVITLNITWIFLLQFSRAFLQTRGRSPIMDTILRFMIMASLWCCILAFMTEYSFIVQLTTRLTIVWALISTTIGLLLWRMGYASARYYTLAWIGYMGGVFINLLFLFGLIPQSFVAENGIQIGAFTNVLLLSLALADRINVQKRETEKERRRALIAREEAVAANERALTHLKKFRQLYDNASEGIFQCSLAGHFLSANPSLAAIFGYESAEALVEEIEDIAEQCYLKPEERADFEKTVLEQGRVVGHEAQYLRQDGSAFWGSSSAHLVRDGNGKPAYIEGSLTDITERMEKEKAQREREAAEASASAKSEFLANMSHEIRTPMNAIIGFAALAKKTQLDDRQRDYVQKIETSSKALLGIINDILDFSKIEAGKMSLELVPFQLYEIMDDLVSILSQKAAEKSLELVVHISPDVHPALIGDPLRLEQILINLTNNALKFTDEGEVVVKIRRLQDSGERTQLQFEVIDTGIGVTAEQKRKLFKPFMQADGSTTRKYGGTGLGLSICKQLVELMEGEIWVESQEGKGSTFAFSIWLEKQADEIRSPYTEQAFTGCRVLVIDDQDRGHDALLEVLASFQCDVRSLEPDYNLIKTLREEQDKNYQVVFIDRQLRAIDAGNALADIRAISAFAETPIVFMTLSSESHLHEQAREAQCQVLIKPATPSVVLTALQSAMGMTATPSRHASTGDNQAPQRSFDGYRVLLVEDTPFNQEIATAFLTEVGFDVTLAENGQEALETLEQSRFDLVLMDVQMPVLDGFETTRRLRSQQRFRDLPIIAMTANAMKGDRNRCLQAGMNDYVSKPVSQEKLYETLAKWLPDTETPEQATAPVLPEDEAMTASPEVPLDLDKARMQMGGSDALLKRMLTRFRTSQANAVTELLEAWDNDDKEAVHRLAHTLKGVAASIGADALSKVAFDLETALEEGAVSTRIELLLSQTDQELNRVLDYLSTQEDQSS